MCEEKPTVEKNGKALIKYYIGEGSLSENLLTIVESNGVVEVCQFCLPVYT